MAVDRRFARCLRWTRRTAAAAPAAAAAGAFSRVVASTASPCLWRLQPAFGQVCALRSRSRVTKVASGCDAGSRQHRWQHVLCCSPNRNEEFKSLNTRNSLTHIVLDVSSACGGCLRRASLCFVFGVLFSAEKVIEKCLECRSVCDVPRLWAAVPLWPLGRLWRFWPLVAPGFAGFCRPERKLPSFRIYFLPLFPALRKRNIRKKSSWTSERTPCGTVRTNFQEEGPKI